MELRSVESIEDGLWKLRLLWNLRWSWRAVWGCSEHCWAQTNSLHRPQKPTGLNIFCCSPSNPNCLFNWYFNECQNASLSVLLDKLCYKKLTESRRWYRQTGTTWVSLPDSYWSPPSTWIDANALSRLVVSPLQRPYCTLLHQSTAQTGLIKLPSCLSRARSSQISSILNLLHRVIACKKCKLASLKWQRTDGMTRLKDF